MTVTEKSYSTAIYELMARYLANESDTAEAKQLETLLAEDEELRADFESMKLLFYNSKAGKNGDGKNFKRVSQRLKDEGLM